MVNMPEIFNLLIGRRLGVFAYICEQGAAVTAQSLAEATGIKTATARTLLRNMAYAGLVGRTEGVSEGKGRHPDQFVPKQAVREWWALTKRTFGVSDGTQTQ